MERFRLIVHNGKQLVLQDFSRALAEHHKSYVVASAIVGLSPLARVAYTSISRITGRNIRAFDGTEAAKGWLVTQALTSG
ncbi:MAG: hypothetical protein ACJ8J7_04610 [Sulfurifustaceae bacterium]